MEHDRKIPWYENNERGGSGNLVPTAGIAFRTRGEHIRILIKADDLIIFRAAIRSFARFLATGVWHDYLLYNCDLNLRPCGVKI